MRFHIGFSKFIKPNQVIKWLGFVFLGLLAFLGFNKNVDAQVLYSGSVNGQTIVDFTKVDAFKYNKNNVSNSAHGSSQYNSYFKRNSGCQTFNSLSYCSLWDSLGTSYWSENYSQYMLANSYQSMGANTTVFNKVSTVVTPNNLCTDYSDTKTISLSIPMRTTDVSFFNYMLRTYYQNYGFSQIDSIDDIFNVYVETNLYNDPTLHNYYTCELQDSDDTTLSNYDYSIYCPSIPYNDDEIESYFLVIENRYYKEYIDSNIGFLFPNSSQSPHINISDLLLATTWDYVCDDFDPYDPGDPIGLGSSDILNIPQCPNGVCLDVNDSINTNFFTIAYPNTFTQFLELPVNLAHALANSQGTCTPFQINFSSLTRRFGGFDYVLTLPCLSSTLQSVFSYQILPNITMYNLIDMFIAFYLLYLFAMRVVHIIDMMMTGQDMVGYIFSGTTQYEGTAVNHRTGEVYIKTRKRRY